MEQTNGPSTCQLLETRDDASTAVGRILDGRQSLFEMAPFAKNSTVNKLSSTCYKENFVICHANTLHSDSRLLCRYAKNGGCLLEKAQLSLKTEQGGSNRLELHTANYNAGEWNVRLQGQLPLAARKMVANAAAYAVFWLYDLCIPAAAKLV